MLRYFRINDPYRLLAIFVILLLMALPVLIDTPQLILPELKSIILGQKVWEGFSPYTGIVDATPPLTDWFYAVCHFLFGDSLTARHLFAFFLIYIQACLLGIIFIDKKVFPDSTYIPPLVFGILCMFSFDTLSLSGELAGSFFLIFALNNVFKELEFKEQRTEYVFNTGLCIGIASLFIFSYGVYVIAALIILGLYSRVTLAKAALTMIGFLLPHLFLISIYYLNESVGNVWNYYYIPNLSVGDSYTSFKTLIVLLAAPLALLLASLVILTRDSRFTKYQSQLVQAMFFWMAFSALQIFISDDLRPQSLITLFPPFAFYLSHMFLMIRRRKFAEISFWILLIGTVGGSLVARYSYLEPNYGKMLLTDPVANGVKGSKLVVLGPEMSLYQGHRLATPFFDWQLSKDIFESPEYYDNQLDVYHGFLNDPPDVILDSENRMAPFFARMPQLKKSYTRTAEGYKRINN